MHRFLFHIALMQVPSLAHKAFPFLIFIAASALYLTTLAPGMLRGDSGEFQWAMASLNVAHATGYPLFTLIGYAWQQVPFSDNVAWQLNLLAAFFGACAVATIFLTIQSVTGRSAAALVGALFFALAPVMWFNASILEVYSLHAFLLALILYLLWRWSRLPAKPTFLYLAFLVLGLALAHHRLTVLALPAIAYFILATDRRLILNVPRLLICLVLLLPGLLLYLYVPLRLLPAGFTLDFAFYDIILGREYAGSLLREINPLPVLVEIPFANFHVGLVLAVIGAVTLFRRAKHWNLALLAIYVLDVGFVLVYSVPDIQVFLTSAFVVTALWIGGGAAFVFDWVEQHLRETWRIAEVALAMVFVILASAGGFHFFEIQTAVAAEAAPEARARAIAASNLPQGAFLELDWETATALRFLQTTERLRPDLEARLIELEQRDEFWRMLDQVNAGRAVFVENGVKWLRAPSGYAVEPVANDLAQIVRAPADISRARRSLSDMVELVGYRATPDALTLYWRLQAPLGKDLATFVHYLDKDGSKLAQDDRAACCQAVYGYRTSEWEPGRIYADVFKPAPPGTKSFLIGMYQVVGSDIEPYGETLTLTP